MPKLKPERIAGIVALSYLVIIPAGAFWAWRKIQIIDKDVTAMWDTIGMGTDQSPSAPLLTLERVRRVLKKQ